MIGVLPLYRSSGHKKNIKFMTINYSGITSILNREIVELLLLFNAKTLFSLNFALLPFTHQLSEIILDIQIDNRKEKLLKLPMKLSMN